MTNNYTYTTNGVTTGVGAVTYDDITNDSPSGTKNGSTLGNGNVWRIRGQAGTGTTGSTNNGWNNSAPEYSQGAQFSTSTAAIAGSVCPSTGRRRRRASATCRCNTRPTAPRGPT